MKNGLKLLGEKTFSEALIKSLPSIFYVFDQSATRIIFWNKNLEYIFGYSNEETAKMSPLDFIAEKNRGKIQGAIARVFKEGKATIESSILTKDGREIPYFFSAARMTATGQNNLVGIGIDISGLKEREQELDRIAKMLVRRDFELFQTNDILRIRDEQIAKEQELNRAKSEFVSLASHQLKTPLTTINWYAEMLLRKEVGSITEEQEKYLETIFHNGRRMVELVNALLNASRVELGALSIDPKPLNLIEVADSVLDELLPRIKDKKLQIEKKYEKNLPIINADPQLSRIIFQNLLSNSVKYAPDNGKITLAIETEKSNILIKVSDNGCGIPETQQAQIFKKLFRADNAKMKDPDGTGLGLYIIKSVLDQSGGKIWFESAENKGAVFYVAIPLKGMEKKKGTKGLV